MANRLEWRTQTLDPGAAALSGQSEVGRHFLEGQPVHAGTPLEVMLDDENWLEVRFELDNRKQPVFYLLVKGTEDQAQVRLPEGAILRWPE